MTGADRDSGFYRALSSRAACEALVEGPATARDRCAASAAYWGAIADAIEAGNAVQAAALTHNVTVFRRDP